MAETPGGEPALVEADRTPGNQRQRAVGLIATAFLALAGLYTLSDFLPAIVWALVIAIGLWPLFQRLTLRWPRHRHGLLLGSDVVFVEAPLA